MKFKDYITNKNVNLSRKDRVFELAQLVVRARAYAGITQKELAKRMKSQQSTISAVENGQNEPSVEFLERVADATGTTIIYPSFEFMQSKNHSDYRVQATLGTYQADEIPLAAFSLPNAHRTQSNQIVEMH